MSSPAHERLLRIVDRLADHRRDESVPLGQALCATCVDVLGVPGAAVTLRQPHTAPVVIGASNDVMAQLGELEWMLGEGPCLDAYDRGVPVAEPDLANPAVPRWLAFSAAAAQTEARAAFGYPLRFGATRFGALNLYADRPGTLSASQHEDALVLADVSLHAVLLARDSPTGDLAEQLLDLATNEQQVHQATGMISVQLSAPLSEALAALRARAWADGRRIGEVATDVVERRLRFER